ncbi:hypothetical protein N7505_010004 [Penicillium chrysogenum]|uniref:chitinase n=1 Tax=Penicillium chrysogenum TaxID=5076 RepID=A0ABQ8W2C1_PENCH|nr:hypothetical protein N7505_010004 [Penicillium chrysogenum]
MRFLSAAKALALFPLFCDLVLGAKGTSGTCSKDKKCDTGCCSKEGYCGFGPNFCSDDVCISNCDAQAECGKYAHVANSTCPLNVCCSEFGFCGTSSDFCGKGCQSGCDDVKQPSCSGTSSKDVYAGYFEAWNYERSCDTMTPSDIDINPWTHLFYSFAAINTDDSTIETTYDHDDEYIEELMDLKKKKPSLKTFISVGGWDLGGEPFSDMVRFRGLRKSFIDSAIEFMEDRGFDGIDIDWEYPTAEDRGGRDEDKENFVTFMKELKEACGSSYSITATLPTSYWYLKGFDVKALSEYVDYFNFMSYDIHGTWDGNTKWTESVVNPHTNLTEIKEGLDLLWRNDVDPAKVMLGLGFYGRSFTLKDSSCAEPGCAFDKTQDSAGGGKAGKCTETTGILTDYEINRVIKEHNPDVVYNEEAAVNWMTWDTNQWVSFDNSKTLKQKADFANSKCLGGLFAWTIDEGGPGSSANPNDLDPKDASMEGASTQGDDSGTGDFYVDGSIVESKSDSKSDANVATAIAPVNIIVAPSSLATPTTFSVDPLVTPLEVAWTTTKTVTVSGQPTVTATIARTIQTTTFSIPPITASSIPWWNWNITGTDLTRDSQTLFPSFTLDPITFRDRPSPQSSSGGVNGTFMTHTGTEDRTFVPPPWPWSTTSLPPHIPTPVVTWTQGGPPAPTCTSNCGSKCKSFCDTPCLLDCSDPVANNNWKDPADPTPPSHNPCSGPDCKGKKCEGDLCVKKGCTGPDCDKSSHTCLGSDCEPTACIGADCPDSGECDGDDCDTHGCRGGDCNGNGRCTGPDCVSLGCIGPDCNPGTGECTGPNCRKVSCSGPHCEDGKCTGEGCESEDDDCESKEADTCTEFITSSKVSSTYSTETSTKCQTITACDATATTTTSTISTTMSPQAAWRYNAWSVDDAAITSDASSLDEEFSSVYATSTSTSTSTTEATTTTDDTATTTTSNQYTPSESSTTCGHGQTMCHLFVSNLHGFCDVAKSYIRGDDIYGTTKGRKSGECYTDGKHASGGCGVFIKGDGCEVKGTTMQAAYDHIFDDCDHACGHAYFDNGCEMKVDYVTGCHTSNN